MFSNCTSVLHVSVIVFWFLLKQIQLHTRGALLPLMDVASFSLNINHALDVFVFFFLIESV